MVKSMNSGQRTVVIGFAGNASKNNFWEAVDVATSWLQRNNVPFRVDREIIDAGLGIAASDGFDWNEVASDKLGDDSDVILSFGGDGTFLTTAWRYGQSGTPILGVNLGRLGFLADVDADEIVPALQAIVDGNHKTVPRRALEVIHSHDGVDTSHWGLNEVVIARSGNPGLITISVGVDGNHLNNYWADGLIVSTPTGSTAYSLSSGGPIVDPGTDALILTPLASHTLTMRPIVLPGSVSLDLHVADGDLPIVFAIDGRSVMLDKPGSTLQIRMASQPVHMVQLPGAHFFDTLREKLMWGFRKRRRSATDPVVP